MVENTMIENTTIENTTIKESTYNVPCLYKTIQTQNCSAPLTAEVPGSKSITNRALLLATLAQGDSTLRGVLFSDDSRHFLKCIQDLGFETQVEEKDWYGSACGPGEA